MNMQGAALPAVVIPAVGARSWFFACLQIRRVARRGNGAYTRKMGLCETGGGAGLHPLRRAGRR